MCFLLAGLSLKAMWTCVAHTGYFILCAVLLTFLRCPGFSRAMLLFMVPLNAVAEVNQQPALDLTSLSVLLLALSLGTSFKQVTNVNLPDVLITLLFCPSRSLVCEQCLVLCAQQKRASFTISTWCM